MKTQKKLVFKKGIQTINIPFLLTDFSPWQEQIDKEIKKCQKEYKTKKSVTWGFEINEHGACVKCYKN